MHATIAYGSRKAERMMSSTSIAAMIASAIAFKSSSSSSYTLGSASTEKPGSRRRRSWLERSCAVARAVLAPW